MPHQVILEFETRRPEQYTAKLWRIPGTNGPFCALPADVGVLKILNSSIFINSYEKDNRVVFPVKYIPKWGENGLRFCLRFIFNSTKAGRSPNLRFLDRLVHEANFYTAHLLNLVGILVPHHFGIFTMETGAWAGRVMFSMTQWCGTPWKTLMGSKLDTAANRLLVGRTLEMFHDLGFLLNSREPEVSMGNPRDFCQILLDVDDPQATLEQCQRGQARCYIVGFAYAEPHECERLVPLLPIGPELFSSLTGIGCDELDNAAIVLGFGDRRKPSLSAAFDFSTANHARECTLAEAIKWHADFSAAHPTFSNSSVLIAQRRALFPEVAPLYPALCVEGVSPEDPTRELKLSEAGNVLDPAISSGRWTREELGYRLWGALSKARTIPRTAVPSRTPRIDSGSTASE
ncbi:hypothetical protein HMN09_00753700 [Mycena chlorophos]|uniref:Uncharacterized protein n=1 Tax=Mycena chlorophos TaxID=658473 RepID=A0A8H6SWA1_MYCCL|nr:hypothetical protein HMN09_00753700 [Mycena chlorophos]